MFRFLPCENWRKGLQIAVYVRHVVVQMQRGADTAITCPDNNAFSLKLGAYLVGFRMSKSNDARLF